MNNNLICPFCHQDINNENHAWNCPINPYPMSPINTNNNKDKPYTYTLSNNSIDENNE